MLLPSAQYRPEDRTPVLITAANKTVEHYLLQLALKTISFFRYLVEHAFSEGPGCPPVLTGHPAVALAPAVGGTSALPLPCPFSPSGSPGLHLSRCLPRSLTALSLHLPLSVSPVIARL